MDLGTLEQVQYMPSNIFIFSLLMMNPWLNKYILILIVKKSGAEGELNPRHFRCPVIKIDPGLLNILAYPL